MREHGSSRTMWNLHNEYKADGGPEIRVLIEMHTFADNYNHIGTFSPGRDAIVRDALYNTYTRRVV